MSMKDQNELGDAASGPRSTLNSSAEDGLRGTAAIAIAEDQQPRDETLWEWMEARGYRNYGNKLEHKYAERVYFKSFYIKSEDVLGYQIEAAAYNSWEDGGRVRKPPYSLSFRMLLNHETPVDVNRMDIMVMRDGMSLAEFENWCDKMWKALTFLFPRVSDHSRAEGGSSDQREESGTGDERGAQNEQTP